MNSRLKYANRKAYMYILWARNHTMCSTITHAIPLKWLLYTLFLKCFCALTHITGMVYSALPKIQMIHQQWNFTINMRQLLTFGSWTRTLLYSVLPKILKSAHCQFMTIACLVICFDDLQALSVTWPWI